MAQFLDATGESWDIKITFAELITLKKRLNFCLAILSEEDRQAKRAEADIVRLADDPELAVNILYVLCESQCTSRGLNDLDFAGRLDAESFTAGIAAIQEELAVFTLPREQKTRGRELARKRAAIVEQKVNARVSALLDKAQVITPEEMQALEAAIAGTESDSSK